MPELDTKFDPFDTNQLITDAYIDPTQTFATPNNQLWPNVDRMNFFGQAPAS